MFRTLYGKLAAILFLLLCVTGAAGLFVNRYATEMYQQEVAQRLNGEVAAHIVSEIDLIEKTNENSDALKEIFHWLMVVHPSIEIYRLDREGRILAYSAPPERVKLDRIDLEPVREFIAGPQHLPLLGDDPRAPGRGKVFSAAAIPGEEKGGYLYVILGGEQFDSVSQLLEASYILRQSTVAFGVALLVALLAGLGLFGLVTSRVRGLARAVEEFRASDFSKLPVLPGATGYGDEIDRLTDTFGRLSERTVDQLERLRQTDLLRRELVANVSHDLRTPLASLQGYIETVLMKEDSLDAADRREYLEIAARQATRLSRLVEELFELAKLDAHETRPEPEDFPIGELLQDVAQKFSLEAAEKHVRVETELSSEGPFVRADIGLIERVLQNLLENALRYTDDGGRIRMRARPVQGKSGKVSVAVEDTGSGISADALPNIFERHYQGGSHRDSSGRAGLGLAIAKRIVELHGGVIAAESDPAHGTTFQFELPQVGRG